MRTTEAARLIITGQLNPDLLWQIVTLHERVIICMLTGRPDYLPPEASTPAKVWDVLDARSRSLVMRRAPARIRRCLPGYIPDNLPQTLSVSPRKSLSAGHRAIKADPQPLAV